MGSKVTFLQWLSGGLATFSDPLLGKTRSLTIEEMNRALEQWMTAFVKRDRCI